MKRPIMLGDYVLASHWSDYDPHDPWRIGYVCRIIHTWKKPTITFNIGEHDGTWTDFREYRHAKRISIKRGIEWLEASRIYGYKENK